MDRKRKRKIKRLWQQRLLVVVSGVAVLGFSVLQLQTVLRHRSPQPSWTLDLSEAVETVVDEKSSEGKQKEALREIQDIAQKRGLPATADLALELELELYLELYRALDLDLDLDRELYLARARALELELELYLGRARDRDLYLGRDLYLYLGRARDLARDLDQELDQELSGVDISKAQALSKELIQALEQAQAKLQGSVIVLVVSTELKQKHELRLYRENIDALQNEDAIRTRAFLTSAILLTSSLLVLMALIVVLSKLQLSYGLAPNSHLIAFLPEECAAELGALKRRMKKKNASAWHIRLRLLQEFLMLLWVFYIKVQLDNLGLPSDRSTDD